MRGVPLHHYPPGYTPSWVPFSFTRRERIILILWASSLLGMFFLLEHQIHEIYQASFMSQSRISNFHISSFHYI